ncbi:hypothetical protein GC197_05545 [bacterium]|nr:hypothetical protein [bacterium]
MDRSTSCVLYEPVPCWAPRLRGLKPIAAVGFVEVRVASELTRLLYVDSQRLLLVALRSSMSAAQVAARLRQVAQLQSHWPPCRVLLLLDEQMDVWHQACWEIGSGLVLVGPKSLPTIGRIIERFLAGLPAEDEDRPQADDRLAWLPW